MRKTAQTTLLVAATAGLGLSLQANATLILDTRVTENFTPFTATTGTSGNDLTNRPDLLYYGQLAATSTGFVDFFYIGNEAAYTNTLIVNGVQAHSSSGLVDNFNAPYYAVADLAVAAGSFLDFGFCTDGGDSVGRYGRCVSNNDARSLTTQYNYDAAGGYRSIGFRSLTSFDEASGLYTFGTNELSHTWMIFWDDSGAKNDDNHDDYIAVARFRPMAVSEPGTALLIGAALLGFGLVRRRRNNA